MIAGIFHAGSGLGNQLHRYVATRVLAADKGLEFGMVNPGAFKGSHFMNLDMGKPVPGNYVVEPGTGKVFIDIEGMELFEEKKVIDENGVDIRGYDPEFNFVNDNTVIDGEFQDERYFEHRLWEINEWLGVEPLKMPNNVCVIGFRGGEFATIPDLFLPGSYWNEAMQMIRKRDPYIRFVCVTDDPDTARSVLPPGVEITHDIADDWRMIRNARYCIISNSSFYILPSLLNKHAKLIIAPRYWARYNTKTWALPQNYYKRFTHI